MRVYTKSMCLGCLFMGLLMIGWILDDFSNSLNFSESSEKQFSNDEDFLGEKGLKLAVEHDPISIKGNGEFIDKGWEGDGTFEDPYIIKDYVIDASEGHGVEIINTSVHFEIKNLIVSKGIRGISQYYNGIKLENVTNGVLRDNEVVECEFGIYMKDSQNNTLSGNTVRLNSKTGIYLTHSDNNTFTSNTLQQNTENGIYLSYSHNNSLSSSTCQQNTQSGLYLSYSHNNSLIGNVAQSNSIHGFRLSYSNDNAITNNLMQLNTKFGLSLSNSDKNTITSNTVQKNTLSGVYLNDCDDNTITSNKIRENSENGIKIYSSSGNNEVSYNTIMYNIKYGVSDDCSEVNSYKNNDFHYNNGGLNQGYVSDSKPFFNYNFWSDHVAPDENDDGIVDLVYNISVSYSVTDRPKDLNPKTKPYNKVCPFYITTIEASTKSNQVHLNWSIPAYDGGANITRYNIYRAVNNSGVIGSYVLIDNSTSVQYIDSKLPLINNVTSYYYKITAVNIMGESSYSASLEGIFFIPSAPKDLKATDGDAQVQLEWSAPSLDGGSTIRAYYVYRKDDSAANYTLIGNTTATSYLDTAVINLQTYYYVVTAVNSAGEGPQSSMEDARPIDPITSFWDDFLFFLITGLVILGCCGGCVVASVVYSNKKTTSTSSYSPLMNDFSPAAGPEVRIEKKQPTTTTSYGTTLSSGIKASTSSSYKPGMEGRKLYPKPGEPIICPYCYEQIHMFLIRRKGNTTPTPGQCPHCNGKIIFMI